jgi:hypothetical protein
MLLALFELCGDPSPPSIKHMTGAPPVHLPVPVVAQQYGGGNQLDIFNIANGAKSSVVALCKARGVVGADPSILASLRRTFLIQNSSRLSRQ